jgi:hypothetical protein
VYGNLILDEKLFGYERKDIFLKNKILLLNIFGQKREFLISSKF